MRSSVGEPGSWAEGSQLEQVWRGTGKRSFSNRWRKAEIETGSERLVTWGAKAFACCLHTVGLTHLAGRCSSCPKEMRKRHEGKRREAFLIVTF